MECIDNKWMGKDFTVIRPDKILGRLLDKEVTVIVLNEDDWDSLVNSKTVKDGYIVGYRVFNWK